MAIESPIEAGVKAGGLLYLPFLQRLVLVERAGFGQDGLVIPKGTPKPGDADLGVTAKREMLEETGYIAWAERYLGSLTCRSIDVESPERTKTNHIFLMHGLGERDTTVAPDERFRLVDPRTTDFEQVMRYPEEAAFVALHVSELLRGHSW